MILTRKLRNLPNSEKEYVKLKEREFIQSERIFNYLILKKQETEITAKEGTEPDHRIVDTVVKNDSEIPISP